MWFLVTVGGQITILNRDFLLEHIILDTLKHIGM